MDTGTGKEKGQQAWDFALGLIKIDGLTPSDDFMELIEKEKKGEITTEDIKRVLDKKYTMKGTKANE